MEEFISAFRLGEKSLKTENANEYFGNRLKPPENEIFWGL